MNVFNARGVAFATKTAAAAIAAMLLALWFGLANPGWAGLTVFLTSQQLEGAAGAVVSRVLYRILGTLLVFAGTLIVIPSFIAAPELLIAGVAAWVALCLSISLLDRSPRSYVFLVAAFTVPLIGLPQANNPSALFDAALLRTEEIALGGIMSAAVHTVFAPRSLKPAIVAKMQATFTEARKWILAGLASAPAGDKERRARDRFGVALAEIRQLAWHLGFEPGISARDLATVTALEERLVEFLPLLAEVECRVAEARMAGSAPSAWIEDHLEAARLRIDPSLARADARPIASDAPPIDAERIPSEADRLLATGTVERLAQLLAAWNGGLALLSHLQDGASVPDEATRRLLAGASRRTLHVDAGLAVFSGLAAATAVAVAGAMSWAIGWDQGTATIGFAAACSSLFASLDDPRPILRASLASIVLGLPVGAFYVFAVIPALDGAVALAAALAPLFFLIALFLATPMRMSVTFFALITLNLLAIQSVQASDFWTFTPTAIGAVLGTLIALVVMSLFRVISAETSVRRLLRATWRDLAAMADDTGRISRAAWGSRMLDRIGLLLPRLAGTNGVTRARADRALDDLRIGMNLLDLRDAGSGADPDVRTAIDGALQQVGAHFRSRLARAEAAPVPAILAAIERVIAGLAASGQGPARLRGLTAATGLRLGLFPGGAAAANAHGAAQ